MIKSWLNLAQFICLFAVLYCAEIDLKEMCCSLKQVLHCHYILTEGVIMQLVIEIETISTCDRSTSENAIILYKGHLVLHVFDVPQEA